MALLHYTELPCKKKASEFITEGGHCTPGGYLKGWEGQYLLPSNQRLIILTITDVSYS